MTCFICGCLPLSSYGPMTTLSKSQVTALLKKEKKVEPKAKEPRLLEFYDPGHSINKLREMFPDFFHSKIGEGWYDNEDFAKEKDKPQMRKISLDIVEGSLNKTFEEQKKMLPKGQEVPTARVLISAILLHYLDSGEKTFEEHWAGTCTRTAHGNLVNVGGVARGLSVVYWGADAGPDAGVASLWTSSEL